MSVISVKCPACKETFQADDGRAFAFCTYCGNKVELAQLRTELLDTEKQSLKSAAEPSAAEPSAAELSQRRMETSEISTNKMSREEFERKKNFERRCAEQIGFCNNQLAKSDKKIVNTRSFFNEHMAQWKEAQYRVQKELQKAES